MRSTCLLALLLLFPLPLSAQRPQHFELHSEHWVRGVPLGAPDTNDLVVRDIYALSSNDERKFADWVAYRLTVWDVEGPELERDWAKDPRLDSDETLEPGDYDGAWDSLGTNRGHQAPLASFRGTLQGDQANYLSNVTPQKAPLNQGTWEELESAVRTVARDDTVWVVTGPLYEESMPRLPGAEEAPELPSGYWKIVVLRTRDSGLAVASFVMDQGTPRGSDYCDHRTPVDDVERRADLDFFWKLGDQVERELETGAASDTLAGRLGC